MNPDRHFSCHCEKGKILFFIAFSSQNLFGVCVWDLDKKFKKFTMKMK